MRERLLSHPARDSRVFEASRLLASEPISVLSLDIFDTLLWRSVPEPVDAFVLLGRRLRDLGHLPGHVSPQLFSRLRELAESRARRSVTEKTPSGEVSLSAIYEQMPARLLGGIGTEELAQMEVALERDICFPDLEILGLAQVAQELCGIRIILVSDTYFSEAQLRHLLNRDPFTSIKVSDVFASSEHKVSKGSGLYKVVLEELGVPAAEVLHIGDHADADIACAGRQGMRTVHYEKFPATLKAVFEREGLLRSDGSGSSKPLDPSFGDFGLTALRSKATASSREAPAGASVHPYWRFGASVLGPVFTGFAEWVHRRAQEEGVAQVYGVMREGQFLSRLVNGARGYLGSPVTASTLWLSRDLCARASLLEASEEELRSFLNRRRPPTLRQLCQALGVGLAQLPEVLDEADTRLDAPQLLERVLTCITNQPDLRAAIVTASARLRERLVQHFVNTVGSESQKVILMDLGWGATIQSYLDVVLRAAGLSVKTVGLYLVTNHLAAERTLDGVHAEGYLASGGIPEREVRILIRSPEILEQVCMTDVGSVMDFTPSGEPIPAPVYQRPLQMLERSAVQRGAVSFQRQWARYRDVVPVDARTLDERARQLLLKMLLGFIVSPTAEEAEMFANWTHDANYGSEESEKVISRELAPFLKHMSPSQLLELPMTRLYWPFGLARHDHPPLAHAAAAVADGLVPRSVLEAEEHDVFVSAYSVGIGSFLPRAVAARLPTSLGAALSPLPGVRALRRVAVHPSGTGLCFIRQEVELPGIRGVQIVFPKGPGIVRLDRMRLLFAVRGRDDPVEVNIEWPEDYRSVAYNRGRRLAKNMLIGTRRAPKMVYLCPRSWHAYKVDVELAFAWLPMAGSEKRQQRMPGDVLNSLIRRAATNFMVHRRAEDG